MSLPKRKEKKGSLTTILVYHQRNGKLRTSVFRSVQTPQNQNLGNPFISSGNSKP